MRSDDLKSLIIFADGACSGNPGPGGWGSIIYFPEARIKELGGARAHTTNNQMELAAIIHALEEISGRSESVIIYTDSVYVIKGITQWIWGWMKRGWKNAAGEPVQNQDFWKRLFELVAARPKNNIQWKFVKGHSGVAGNERCDVIAVAFSKHYYIDLYDGPLLQYSVPLLDLPEDKPLPENKGVKEKSKALYYLSYVGGELTKHTTWAECERRVKGQSGAKFKKITSLTEEESSLRAWGIKK